jgi:hypothetical protein
MQIIAYIDPGAGSLLIQALIAAALSVPFLFRRSLRAVIERVRHRSGEPAGEQHPPSGHD